MMKRGRILMVLLPAVVVLLLPSCTEPQIVPPATAPPVTEPTSGTEPVPSTGLPTTVPMEAVALPNVFGAPADEAIAELQSAGLAVIAYDVCSASVGAGEVRQVVYPDGTELVGEGGVTREGSSVPVGSSIEVKVGTGEPCG